MTRAGAVVAAGGVASAVITPKVLAAPNETPGLPSRIVFVMLNDSARNSMCEPSVTWNCRVSDISHCQNDGPTTEYAPMLPKVPVGAAANAPGLSHCSQNDPAAPHEAPWCVE